MRRRSSILSASIALFLAIAAGRAQTDSPDPSPIEPVVHPAAPFADSRILGIIPTYQMVEDPNRHVDPLTVRQKFTLFVKETVDPYTLVSAAAGAGMSQYGNGTPSYGDGMASYGKRFGAAYADVATQNFFSDAVLASILHEDPRYYRMGPGHAIPKRIWYSVSRIAITRTDAGKDRFNFSGVGGMAMGIALSNAYYPDKSVNGSVTSSRFITSLTAAGLGNLLPEFWPDVKQLLHRRKD